MRQPPPLGAMSNALTHAGVTIQEAMFLDHRGHATSVAILFAGMVRLCDVPEYTQYMLDHRASALFLLQADEDDAFDACHSAIAAVAAKRPTAVILGRQWFGLADALPCGHAVHTGVPRGGMLGTQVPFRRLRRPGRGD